MKRIYITVLVSALIISGSILFAGCSKAQERQYEQDLSYSTGATISPNATIVATDERKCACCGGFLLSINGQKPVASDYFLTYDFPGGYKPTSFPVKVYIDWEKDRNACINDKVTIKRIIVIK